jgi:hypothetical protein
MAVLHPTPKHTNTPNSTFKWIKWLNAWGMGCNGLFCDSAMLESIELMDLWVWERNPKNADDVHRQMLRAWDFMVAVPYKKFADDVHRQRHKVRFSG